jgi:hypothetical protein
VTNRQMLRRLSRFGPLFAVAAVAGYVLGACGGGDGSALTTRTDLTGTRPAVTGTRPTETVVTTVTNTETTTTEVTTSETTTVSEPPPPSPPPPPPAATTTEPASDASESAAWALIVLGLALAAALLIGGLVIARRRRGRAASWSSQLADLTRRSLVALDDVLREGSVVTGRIQALADEAGSLETRAPDDASKAAAARLRARLDDLAGTLETDRTLRLSSPPPSAEQLSYSTALIRQQVQQLQGVLRPPPAPSP